MGHLRMIKLYNFFAKTFLVVGGLSFILQLILRFVLDNNGFSIEQLNLIQLDSYALLAIGALMILGFRIVQK